jgi:hypothetical protein
MVYVERKKVAAKKRRDNIFYLIVWVTQGWQRKARGDSEARSGRRGSLRKI